MEQLKLIQQELKAPKNQRNDFGKYNYRSCEDIMEAVKPLLKKHDCYLTLTDEVKEAGGIIYVEATAILSNHENIIQVQAQAGIDPNRKGMDISQSFGSSSSYARKYALNGLFLIDDTKDADTNEQQKQVESKAKTQPKQDSKSDKPKITEEQYKKTLEAPKNQIQAVLKAFDGNNGKGMKKEYREALNKLI